MKGTLFCGPHVDSELTHATDLSRPGKRIRPLPVTPDKLL
jgi:hypothetical protein